MTMIKMLMEVVTAQKHFLWTMDGPHSSYSCLVIHICWKVEREAKMDPPIHTEYFLSGGAMTLVLPIVCKRKSLPWLPPPSRSRSLLLQKGNTLYGLVDPSWPPSPPSNRCGSPSKSTTNLVPALSTGSASKHFLSFVRYKILCADSIFKLWVFKITIIVG